MTDTDVWVYIASNSTFIGAYATDEEALDEALRQGDENPTVELVTVHASKGRPHGPQSPQDASGTHPVDDDQNVPHTGTQSPEGDA